MMDKNKCERCENKIPGEQLEPCAVCKHWIEKMAGAGEEDLADCVAKLVAENSRLRIALGKIKPDSAETEKEPSDES